MALKIYLLCFTTALMCAQVLTKNVESSSSNDITISMVGTTIKPDITATENGSTISRDDLYYGVLNRYYKLAYWTLGQFKFMLNHSIADILILKETNKNIKQKVSEFNDIISQIDYIETATDTDIPNKTFKLFNKFFEYLDTFNTTAQENPTAEDVLVELSLLKNHRFAIKDQFWLSFEELLHQLYANAEKYWNFLPEDEKAKEKRFLAWLTEFKNFKMSAANEMYAKFTELFNNKQ